MRLAHPVMRRRRAHASSTALGSRGTTSIGSRSRRPPVSTAPVLVVPCVLTIVNELREPVHAELVELALRVARPGGVPSWSRLPSPTRSTPGPDAASNRWRVWLEDRWDDFADEVERPRERNVRPQLAQRLPGLLPALLREERVYQDRLFRNRLERARREAGETGRERLRRQIEKLEDQMNQLTFDPEPREDREDELRQLREQLEGEEYRRVEERRASAACAPCSRE